jgi:HD-GYP domain-containing protein (c-di-GMP phosphodiesterase class II)
MSEPAGVPRDGAAEEARLAERGPQLLLRLAAMLRTAKTHDVSNQAFQRQLRDLLALVETAMAETEGQDELALVTVGDHFYLNGIRIRAQASLLAVYHALMGEFERRGLGGVRFLYGLTAAELERFFQLFTAAEDAALAERLIEAVREASIAHLVPVAAVELDAENVESSLDSKEKTERARAKRVFWRAVLGTRRIVLQARQTGRPDMRQAKRLVQPIVDSIMRHEFSMVGLTALKEHDEYTYAHCVNVSILAVGMGQVLGLPRQSLADLGVAALLHDIGKTAVPGTVLRKPASLSQEEWALMRRHPLEGVKIMSRMPGLTAVTLDAMRVCLEHHMNFDRSGYPEIAHDWGQATLSRIVAVADCFDAITAHRSYNRPRTPYEGLEYLLGPIRVNFDPAALWALVKTVGLYPAGTVVQTDSGHVALALSPNPTDVRRPHCRVLVHPDGTTAVEGQVEDWTPMPPERSVTRVIAADEHALPTAEQLAA